MLDTRLASSLLLLPGSPPPPVSSNTCRAIIPDLIAGRAQQVIVYSKSIALLVRGKFRILLPVPGQGTKPKVTHTNGNAIVWPNSAGWQ